MRCGLYGKLPTKRDFIAIATPREFLAVWEPWLQGGISASRNQLGASWQEAYLRAPIWRFWLGSDFCGGATLGAIMPSVDGVGRYFPLTVFARADPGDDLPPPELATHSEWFDRSEDLLLSALSEQTSFEALSDAFGRLAGPGRGAADGEAARDALRMRDGTLVAPAVPDRLGSVLSSLRQLDGERTYSGSTFWWTLGGEGFPPQVLAKRGLPDPYLFSGMLTGQFHDAL